MNARPIGNDGTFKYYIDNGNVYRVRIDNAGPVALDSGMPGNVRWLCSCQSWAEYIRIYNIQLM